MKPIAWIVAAAITSSPAFAQFELRLSTSEPYIAGAKLRQDVIVKRFALNPQLVQRSRNFAKVATVLNADLERIFNSLERDAVNARFVQLPSSNWEARQQSAWQVDAAATRKVLLKAIVEGRETAEIALTVTRPQRNVENWAARGILQRFGGGESAFYGSKSFRVQNIVAASRILDGAIIAPGGEYDYNAALGELTPAKGFVDGYIIASGTLKKEIGGGICQVSTTVWRAAYLAGLPITVRSNHSYRVSYYELATPRFAPPIGFEATVYAPYKNLKFKNDSGSSLLMQVSVNPRRLTMRVDLFGATPQRRVTVAKPVYFGVKPAPAARFQADASVPLGRTRQIDGAVGGISVRQLRTVSYDDGRTLTDTTRSTYVPWGAIFAVNPLDPRVAPKTTATARP